jgi:prephenate dehydrogenase
MLFIGMDVVGTSISLALANEQHGVLRIGYDADPDKTRTARKLGAFDQLVSNPIKTAREAEIVFLNVPAGEALGHLETLAPILREDAVLFDFSSLKQIPQRSAQAWFPEGRYYVGAVPVLNPDTLYLETYPVLSPRPDLLAKGLLALTFPMNTPETVMELAHSLAAALQANPYFIDPAEVDGVITSIEHLPLLLSLALLNVSIHSPGWREIQRMTGRLWLQMVLPSMKQPPELLAAELAENKDNVVDRIQSTILELARLRDQIAAGDTQGFQDALEDSQDAYDRFFHARQQADWGRDALNRSPLPDQGFIGRVLGFGGMGRRKSKE